MKKNVFIAKVFTCLTVAASAMALLSCSDNLFESDDNNLPQSSHFFVFGSTADSTTTTRVAYVDENYTKSTFEDGDVVRVYQLSGGAGSSVVKSARYKVANNTSDNTKYLTPENDNDKISQHNGTTYAFVYPDPGANTDITKLSHTIKDNQNSKENFEASDLLWDVVTASNDKATIEMDHAMAQIILEADEKVAGESATITLSGSPAVSISGLNLTYGKENDAWSTSASATKNTGSTTVTMWNYGYNSDQNRIFRAVVPAQTMKAAKFLTIQGGKSYKLEEDLEVSGGNNYILHINKNSTNPDQPEINDDDSWVLDVLDPETGEPVGLLCREYLRYQPEHLNQNFDYNTGTETDNKKSKWINSQAWVFYNLQDFKTRIPDLDKGTVLRFIFDFQRPGFVWWPVSEGYNFQQWGIFSPIHGANWTTAAMGGADGANAQGCGHEIYGDDGKPFITEYYMHGGTIKWDGKKNEIKSFTMPEAQIKCADAEKYGHIAIDESDKDNIKVYVSYNQTEPTGIKKGVLMPHYLVDKRKVGNTTEVNKYPLVKIGYNQFWMSKSLNTKYMTDGTPLTSYNKEKDLGVTFNVTDKLTSAGYLYPFKKDVKCGANQNDNKTINYDPYNNEEQMAGNDKFKPLPLYNTLCAVQDSKFVPTETDDKYDRVKYYMPTYKMIKSMHSYFHNFFGQRMMSRYISIRDKSKSDWYPNYSCSPYESILNGESREGDCGAYTANVSGFNCRALGWYNSWANNRDNFEGLTGTCSILLKPSSDTGAAYFNFFPYESWGDSDLANNLKDQDDWSGAWYRPTQFFCQVRFVMKFKNQADTGGNSSNAAATRAASTSAAAKSSSNNVYVQLIEK